VRHERLFWAPGEAGSDPAGTRDGLAAEAVRFGWERSEEIRGRLEAAGIDPEAVRSAADLAAIPILSKERLPELQRARPPFGGMLAVPVAELRRIFRSPGGICDPEGREEDYWRVAPALWAAGFRPGDIVLNTLSYHLTPGGHMLDAGLRAVGCVAIPGGIGNRVEQVETAIRAGATGYVGTPQFLVALAETALEDGAGQPFRRALVTGGPLFPPVRERLERELGIDVFQAYGTADAGVLGYECTAKDGWHVAPDAVIEIVPPGEDACAAPGQTGEVVVTRTSEVYPLVRFGTGDLSALAPGACTCGRSTPRLVGFLGRVGEGVKVRGMFVHPRQLAAALDGFTVHRYQGAVTHDGRDDTLTLSVEAGDAQLDPSVLAAALREATKVRVEVAIVARGTLAEDCAPLIDARRHA